MADEYDIVKAFETIENELMASMIRNMKRHKAEEVKEDKQWSMWQAEQLKALEKYKKEKQNKYTKLFKSINSQIKALILQAKDEGEMQQEIAILNAIKNGFEAKHAAKGATAEFFKLNERKLEALIEATIKDMKTAETAVLRMANDQYRKIIFNAQVYANTGAGTYEQAVDMATKDFRAAGLNCVEYSNGARHTLSDYADMAIRTASKRAYLQGEGAKRQEWGIYTVIINKRGNPCPKCLPFCGKVMIDDVWSGGPKDGKSPLTGITYPLMSNAVAAGLYHPRCKDSHTTYFEGISTPPDDKYTKEELNAIVEKNQQEARQQYAKRQAEKFRRMAKFSLDGDNQKKYREKERQRAEQSTKGQIRGTVMERSIVKSSEYKRRVDTLSEEKAVKQAIWKEMLGAVRHRSGTVFEDLIFIHSKTGEIRRSVDFEQERTAIPTKAMRKMLRKTELNEIIAIHNHPGSTVPSWSDIEAAKERRYKYGLIACHNGQIFKYRIIGDINEPMYQYCVATLDKKGYNKDSLKEFCEKAHDAGIEMEVL